MLHHHARTTHGLATARLAYLLVLLGLLLLLPAQAQAVEYHVSKQGRDDHAGTSRAADQVRPGDTVLIHEGTYSESVRLRVTGTQSQPITFKAAPGEKVVFDGLDRTLDHIFMGSDKHYLRFDGFYFTGILHGSDSVPWIADPLRAGRRNGCIVLYYSDHARITRCFQNGFGQGYSPGLVMAMHSANLEVSNNAIFNAMGAGVTIFWDSPGACVHHNVFVRNLIRHTSIHIWEHKAREPEQACYLQNNIFTDNKGSKLHQPLFYNGGAVVNRANCYYIRVPADERHWSDDRLKTLADYIAHAAEKWPQRKNIVADPMFKGTLDMNRTDEQGDRIYLGARIVSMENVDFPDLFATDPEVIERDMGLQREAFEDFHFNQDEVKTESPSVSHLD